MNLFEPRQPEEVETPFIALVTFREMFAMNVTLASMEAGEKRDNAFMNFMKALGIDDELDALGIHDEDMVTMTVTDGGLNNEPPQRVMSILDYREYLATSDFIGRVIEANGVIEVSE